MRTTHYLHQEGANTGFNTSAPAAAKAITSRGDDRDGYPRSQFQGLDQSITTPLLHERATVTLTYRVGEPPTIAVMVKSAMPVTKVGRLAKAAVKMAVREFGAVPTNDWEVRVHFRTDRRLPFTSRTVVVYDGQTGYRVKTRGL